MKQLIIKSPAKVNLYLEVLRKRPDGYHDIETIFEKVALFDIITIRPGQKGIRVTSDKPSLPIGRANLIYRAARALFKKTGFKGGARIDIRKNIPVAGGMGGGSSNAAAVLKGANAFFKLGLNRGELAALGRDLGSDVPFFLGDTAFAVGLSRGDKIRPLYLNNIKIWHIIIYFDFGVSTKWTYGRLNLKLTHKPNDVTIPLRVLRGNNSVENLGPCLYNRLEEVTAGRLGPVRLAKRVLLEEGAAGAVLSGSGPTVFGIVSTREEGVAIKKRIEERLSGCGAKVAVAGTTKGA